MFIFSWKNPVETQNRILLYKAYILKFCCNISNWFWNSSLLCEFIPTDYVGQVVWQNMLYGPINSLYFLVMLFSELSGVMH